MLEEQRIRLVHRFRTMNLHRAGAARRCDSGHHGDAMVVMGAHHPAGKFIDTFDDKVVVNNPDPRSEVAQLFRGRLKANRIP